MLGVSLFLLVTALPGQAVEVEPPLVGRPKDFSGAVGSYTITSQADPTELVVEEPLTLTVRITGAGPNPKYLPKRLKLAALAADVERGFYVEDLPQRDRYLPAEKTWEFIYRLRPKNEGVQSLPRLRYVFYDPKLPEGRRFQPRFTRETIVLTVKPRPVEKPAVKKRIEHPERFFEVETGDAVLSIPRLPLTGALGLAALVVVPPALCALWYSVWRRLYPDALAMLKQRRSRAAKVALEAFGKLGSSADGERVAAIMADYFRQRLDLAPVDPTPPEAAEQVRRCGLSSELSERVVALLRACDQVRFAPAAPGERTLASDAQEIILAVEAELCAAPAA